MVYISLSPLLSLEKPTSEYVNSRLKTQNTYDEVFRQHLDQYSQDGLNKNTIGQSSFSQTILSAINNYNFDNINSNTFQSNGADASFHQLLISEGILNENGYINFKNLSLNKVKEAYTNLITNALSSEENASITRDELAALLSDDAQTIFNMLKNEKNKKSTNYEIFKPNAFETSDGNLISLHQSELIWEHLLSQGLIDEYGAFTDSINFIENTLIPDGHTKKPKTEDLINAIANIPNLSDEQGAYVLHVLEKFPSITYYSYLNAKKMLENSDSSSDSELIDVGRYVSKDQPLTPSPDTPSEETPPLSEEEYEVAKATATLEYRLYLITQKGLEKIQKKIKENKKEIKIEDERNNAIEEAKATAKRKQEANKNKRKK